MRSVAPVYGILAWTGATLLSQGTPKDRQATELFVWRTRYADGLRAAVENRRHFLVYLPPAGLQDEPASVVRLPQNLGVPPILEGVRVTSEEVLDLMKQLRVKKLPALVLLDRRENILAGWEDGVPADVLQRLLSALRKIDERDARDARVAQEARKSAVAGRLEDAYKRVLPLLESPLTSPENLQEAQLTEAELLQALRRSALRVLAQEGLRPDAGVIRSLEALRASTSHPGIQHAMDREILRLRSTSPVRG